MFYSKEIRLMKKLGLNFDFSSLSNDDLVKIEKAVRDFYTQEIQRTSASTKVFLCETILGKINSADYIVDDRVFDMIPKIQAMTDEEFEEHIASLRKTENDSSDNLAD